MRSRDELVSLANENFIASFRKLVEHSPSGDSRAFGGVFAFASGLPLSLFNGCVVVEPSAPTDLDAALGWVAGRRVPQRLFVAAELETELEAVAAKNGLERDPVPYPGMVLHPIPEPPEAAPGVVIAPIDDSGREEFLGVGEALGLDARPGRGALPSVVPPGRGCPAVRRASRRPRGRLLARDPKRRCDRCVQRRHAAGGPPARRGNGVDVGSRRGGSGAGLRLCSAPVVGDGRLDVRGDGIPDGRALRGLQPARARMTVSSTRRSCPP